MPTSRSLAESRGRFQQVQPGKQGSAGSANLVQAARPSLLSGACHWQRALVDLTLLATKAKSALVSPRLVRKGREKAGLQHFGKKDPKAEETPADLQACVGHGEVPQGLGQKPAL